MNYQDIAHEGGGTLYAYTNTGKLWLWENDGWEPTHSAYFDKEKIDWDDVYFSGRVDHEGKRISVLSNLRGTARTKEDKFLERLMKRLYKKWPDYTFWFWSSSGGRVKQIT